MERPKVVSLPKDIGKVRRSKWPMTIQKIQMASVKNEPCVDSLERLENIANMP